MKIPTATALVTGANRGLGMHLAQELRDRGADVYAGARDPDQVTYPGVTPVRIDVTDQSTIDAALEVTGPVSILVNNAGSSTGASLLTGDPADLRTELDVHLFGSLAMTRAVAPRMASLPESAVLNILSVLSWVAFPAVGAYCAAKAAAWSMTNSLRQELAPQGTTVTGLHVGYMDTDMARGLDVAKSAPADIARIAIDAVERGDLEVIADDITAVVLDSLSGGVPALYPGLVSATD
jgi:NAD(P)-dependent dehydrogenase (short-subunit alcohol dehydrogenase family)